MRPDRTGWRAFWRTGRSGSSATRYGNSFCRQLGRVALLDFGPTAVDDWGQFNNWSGWIGHQQQARVAVWLEIDRRAAAQNVIDAGALHHKWKDNPSKQVSPGVEAGHRDPVPVGCIGALVLIDRYGWSTFDLRASRRRR